MSDHQLIEVSSDSLTQTILQNILSTQLHLGLLNEEDRQDFGVRPLIPVSVRWTLIDPAPVTLQQLQHGLLDDGLY